ncbi:PREDICTED: speract receptor-like [Rhagoletis zephyria]|uniref:speract receptor-like n=1 Tax=Rhagoletis zephyria TaxID=28612 RepID=UPI0008116B22|nr:PREDICTED: speract receptor-like [Rhagoletis zephyria]
MKTLLCTSATHLLSLSLPLSLTRSLFVIIFLLLIGNFDLSILPLPTKSLNHRSISKVSAEVFTLGYLTGSQRSPGNLDYQRPGITISGAITLAVSQVNAGRLKELGHSLEFIVAETYGDEVSSIRQTASLWTRQVAGYIGPQETCVHEGRMAAAFNLPMISYYCIHRDTSNKQDFPTFARTRPPDTQISKSVVSLLLAFNWTQVSFLYLDSPHSPFHPVAETIQNILHNAGVIVRDIQTWNTIYHHGFMVNPFDELVERTYKNTRSQQIHGAAAIQFSQSSRLFWWRKADQRGGCLPLRCRSFVCKCANKSFGGW